MSTDSSIAYLHKLAHLYQVQTAYYDVAHRRKPAPVESLLAVLRALGAPVASLNDVPSALRERRQAIWQRPLEPVTIAWGGGNPVLRVRLPAGAPDSLVGHLKVESRRSQPFKWHSAELPVLETADIEGMSYAARQITLPSGLPWGYHRFTLEMGGKRAETLIISAPVKTYQPESPEDRRWGVFLPLYALRTVNGGGDYASLTSLVDWVAGLGGRVAATLPLLSAFMDEPFDPSPYAPASRRLWNEFYVNINGVPELAGCPKAEALLQSLSTKTEIEKRQALPLVDYRRQMAAKRRALEELSRCLSTERQADLQSFTVSHPLVADYARFRAVMERQGTPWRSWPEPLRDGKLRPGDYDEETRRYYVYAQWLAHQQVQALSARAREKGVALYFDLPTGVHPGGYDAWREHHLFGRDTNAGAPPDAGFTRGQDWGFPPLHPEHIREQGYRYVIEYLRHHLEPAGMLRIDHIMGLHRLFWIPHGLAAREGVYVRYHADEFYAILALESHRHRSIIVGEDLGTVPPYVRPAMARHGLHRMYVMYYETAANPQKPLHSLPADTVASLNTHDMATFAAFWEGRDIEQRLSLGLLNRQEAQKERETLKITRQSLRAYLQKQGWLQHQAADTGEVLAACLSFLSASRAGIVLVNLEDLWLETQPQNVPSLDTYPNWQRKARYRLEEFAKMPEVLEMLRDVDRLRKHKRRP
jgi:4-alpha-glucanotransferase